MKHLNKITSVIIAVLIALFAFISAISVILGNTFSDPDFMLDILDTHEYYDHIFSEYSESVEDLAVPSGVPEGRFTAVISKDDLIKDIKSTVKAAYSENTGYAGDAVDLDAVYNKFYDCLTEVALESGFKINDNLIPALENVASLCTDTYGTYITLPFIDTIGSYAVEFDRYFSIATIVGGAFTLFFAALLLASRVWRKNSVTILAVAFNTVGFMLTVAPTVLLSSGKIQCLNIAVKSLYNFAVGYSTTLLYCIVYCGIGFLAVGCLLTVLSFILKRKTNSVRSISAPSL